MRSGPLSTLLPTPTETDLLRACLWSGAAASDAWSRWQPAIGGAERASTPQDPATKGLLPLLHHALRRNAVSVAAPLRAALGVAALAEERRYQAYRDISVRALDLLAAASIPCLVLKGAALAEMVYPDSLWRAAPAAADRVELLRWMFVPSPTSLRRGTPLRYPRLWALAYLERPARYLIGAVRRRRS